MNKAIMLFPAVLLDIARKSKTLLLLPALLLVSCAQSGVDTGEQATICDAVTEIEGQYNCSGECVVTGADGTRQLVQVSGETDTIQRFSAESESIYQVNITGSGGFTETEIGGLSGRTLRTATAEVSDGLFPVLEEYLFDTGPACQAQGFSKIVRNPSSENFKSCVIRCRKSTSP